MADRKTKRSREERRKGESYQGLDGENLVSFALNLNACEELLEDFKRVSI